MKIQVEAKYYDIKFVLKQYFNLDDYIEIEDIYINKVHIDGNIIEFDDNSLFVAKTTKTDINTTAIVGISDIKCLFIKYKTIEYTFIFD